MLQHPQMFLLFHPEHIKVMLVTLFYPMARIGSGSTTHPSSHNVADELIINQHRTIRKSEKER